MRIPSSAARADPKTGPRTRRVQRRVAPASDSRVRVGAARCTRNRSLRPCVPSTAGGRAVPAQGSTDGQINGFSARSLGLLTSPPHHAPLAQLAEQRTLNPRVRGSSPWRRTRKHVPDLRVLEVRGRAVVVPGPCWAGNGQGWRNRVVSANPPVRFPRGARSRSVVGSPRAWHQVRSAGQASPTSSHRRHEADHRAIRPNALLVGTGLRACLVGVVLHCRRSRHADGSVALGDARQMAMASSSKAAARRSWMGSSTASS